MQGGFALSKSEINLNTTCCVIMMIGVFICLLLGEILDAIKNNKE